MLQKTFVESHRPPPRLTALKVCGVLLLATLVALPALAGNPGEKKQAKKWEQMAAGGKLVPLVAQALHGRWQLDARIVTTGTKQQAATAQQLTVYDIRTVSETAASGKVMILESGILDTFVETPALFAENPDLVGNSYSIGGLWDVELTEVADPRCSTGTGVSMRFDGESEGSYGIFKYGCVASTNTAVLFCQTPSGFEMAGVVRTETGVEGVNDVWTGFSVSLEEGTRPRLMHELPRETARDGEVPILRDYYTKVDSETKVRRQSVEGLWKELVKQKTLINDQLNVVQLLAAL